MSQKVTEITLDSGVRIYIAPLSRYQRQALNDAAAAKYPYPEKADYEEAMPEGIAIDGLMIPAEQNPAYQQEIARINGLRSSFLNEGMLSLSISFPDYPAGKAALIEEFADYVAQQRQFMTLPEDDWLATWRFAILRSPSDENQILAIVGDELPLTEKEVNDNVRVFQPAISWEKSRTLAIVRRLASSTKPKVQNQP